MLKQEREKEIIRILEDKGRTSVLELSKLLYTSESTVRRILFDLDRKGVIRRSYGSAELIQVQHQVAQFHNRLRLNIQAKKAIAAKAAAMVPDGSIVFLDQSTTAYHLAAALMERKSLTVVTNNIEIAGLLSGTDFEIILSGGRLSRQVRVCMVGEDAHRIFREIYGDFAFFSACSISEDGVVSDCDREEILVRKAMLDNAKTKVVLCDSSKFNTRSAYRQCHLSELDALISEDGAASCYQQYLSVR